MEVRYLLQDGTVVDSPFDIRDINDKKLLYFFNVLKAAEFTQEFQDFVKRKRKEWEVPPEGYDVKHLKKLKEENPLSIKIDGKEIKYGYLQLEIQGAYKKLGISTSSKALSSYSNSLLDLILFGVVKVQEKQLSIYIEKEESTTFKINIVLTSKISKNALLNFIKENYDKKIKPFFVGFPVPDKKLLTKRDIRLLQLRKQGKTYKEIMDYYAENPEDVSSEEAVGKACRRALKKIKKRFNYNKSMLSASTVKHLISIYKRKGRTYDEISRMLGDRTHESSDEIEQICKIATRKLVRKIKLRLSKYDKKLSKEEAFNRILEDISDM
jgi:transcriptional regulator